MVIFNSYVSLPEGNGKSQRNMDHWCFFSFLEPVVPAWWSPPPVPWSVDPWPRSWPGPSVGVKPGWPWLMIWGFCHPVILLVGDYQTQCEKNLISRKKALWSGLISCDTVCSAIQCMSLFEFIIAIGFEMLACKVHKRRNNYDWGFWASNPDVRNSEWWLNSWWLEDYYPIIQRDFGDTAQGSADLHDFMAMFKTSLKGLEELQFSPRKGADHGLKRLLLTSTNTSYLKNLVIPIAATVLEIILDHFLMCKKTPTVLVSWRTMGTIVHLPELELKDGSHISRLPQWIEHRHQNIPESCGKIYVRTVFLRILIYVALIPTCLCPRPHVCCLHHLLWTMWTLQGHF